MKATQQLHQLGQSLWLDNITRDLLDSGTLKRYIDELSVTGLTSNPSIFDHAIRNSGSYDDAIRRNAEKTESTEQLFFKLAIEDLDRAADLFKPIHDSTQAMDGWVSLEVSPYLAYEAEKTVKAAQQLSKQANRSNIFIKIPGTEPGLVAIENAIFAGINVNVTLLFSGGQYLKAADAYMRGIERRIQAGLSPQVHSVASIFISRWDKAVSGKEPEGLRDRLGIAVAMQAYKSYRGLLASERWKQLAAKKTPVQRLLWASTGTKDPKASDTLYIQALASPGTINTMPDKTLLALADHGRIANPLPEDGGDSEQVLAKFAAAKIDPKDLAEKLQVEGADAFNKSWDDLMECIESKTQAVKAHA